MGMGMEMVLHIFFNSEVIATINLTVMRLHSVTVYPLCVVAGLKDSSFSIRTR